MKILFAGTPEIAVPSLKAAAEEFDVVGVLTAPDKVSGRGRSLTPSPVKAAAEELGLNVLQPERLGAEARSLTADLGADLLVVFAYGRIFGPKYLSLFPLGGINMHPSALPKYRGPSPITAVLLAGDAETALTVQRISREMDAGDIIRQTPFPLNGTETSASLTEAVAQAAAGELTAAIRDIEEGKAVDVPQEDAAAVYCRLVKKEDGIVDWTLPAVRIERMIRAYTPWPRAVTTHKGAPLALLEASPADFTDAAAGGVSGIAEIGSEPAAAGHSSRSETPGKPIGGEAPAGALLPGTVLGVDKSRGILIQTGEGILAVTRLQAAGRKPLDFRSFLNGIALDAGTILGEYR